MSFPFRRRPVIACICATLCALWEWNGRALAAEPTPTPVPGLPVIHVDVAGIRAERGVPFAYTISATGAPFSYDASPLPAGLRIDRATGRISGIPTDGGAVRIRLSATNAVGTGHEYPILAVDTGNGAFFTPIYQGKCVAEAVSADGLTMVGESFTSNGAAHAFRWTPEYPFRLLPEPEETSQSEALSVNADGSVITENSLSKSNTVSAYLFRPDGANAGLFSLPVPSTVKNVVAFGISADASVVIGSRFTNNSSVDAGAVRWLANGEMISLTDPANGPAEATGVSADGRITVGALGGPQAPRAVKWENNSGPAIFLGALVNGAGSEAHAVSADGSVIVGAANNAAQGSQAFRWTAPGGMEALGDSSSSFASAKAVSADGMTIVGSAGATSAIDGAGSYAFVWTAKDGFRRLMDVLVQASPHIPSYLHAKRATAVSADGRIIVGVEGFEGAVEEHAFIAGLPLAAGPLPTLGTPPSYELYVGRAFSYQLQSSPGVEYDVVGLPPGLQVSSTGLISGLPLAPGRFYGTASVTNGAGTTYVAFSFHVSPTVNDDKGVAVNISTRARVGSGDGVLIGGFIVTGTEPKRVIIRAMGASLAGFGVPDALLDPVLELHGSAGNLIRLNKNWRDDQEAEILQTGLAPSDNRESAIVATLAPGQYTAVVAGAAGTEGVALVEIYDLDATPAVARVANISTRGQTSTGDNVMIGGFIIDGDLPVLVRGIGPSLSAVGVHGAIQDPVLTLYDISGNIVGENDDWQTSQDYEIGQTNAAPRDPRESALLLRLPKGNYTAVVRDENGATGVALVEVYSLKQ